MNENCTNENVEGSVNSNRFAAFLAGLLAGAVGWGLVLVLVMLPWVRKDDVLFRIRNIQLGVTESKVVEQNGAPGWSTQLGEPFPIWAESQVPMGFEQDHRLAIYSGWTDIVLVFYDSNDRVVFVSWAPT